MIHLAVLAALLLTACAGRPDPMPQPVSHGWQACNPLHCDDADVDAEMVAT